jgi:hypothetical protein
MCPNLKSYGHALVYLPGFLICFKGMFSVSLFPVGTRDLVRLDLYLGWAIIFATHVSSRRNSSNAAIASQRLRRVHSKDRP